MQLRRAAACRRARSRPGAGSRAAAPASISPALLQVRRPASRGGCRRCCRACPRRPAAACGSDVASCWRSSAGFAARSSAWIWWRGVITSSTVIVSRSNRFASIARCLPRKYWPSSTSERSSSCVSVAPASSARLGSAAALSSPCTNRLTNETTGCRRLQQRREHVARRAARCGRRAWRRSPSA